MHRYSNFFVKQYISSSLKSMYTSIVCSIAFEKQIETVQKVRRQFRWKKYNSFKVSGLYIYICLYMFIYG